MGSQPDRDLHRQVNETFEAFRTSLQELLAREAQQQVDSALKRLGEQPGPFRVEDVDVEVVIHRLELAATSAGPSAAPPAKPRKPATPRRRRSSGRTARRARATGSVRQTLLDAFPDTQAQLDVAALRSALDRNGVTASVDNVHQHLRRLVLAGDLKRAGRGLYQRVTPPSRAA